MRHPLTGEPIEVWVANYVLMSYGEGAVMGVPAHDERDFEFAQRHGIAMRTVVQPDGRDRDAAWATEWAPELRRLPASRVNSGEFSGLESAAAIDGDRRRARAARPRAASACNGGCGTGASRASATGAARFR